VEGRTVLYEHRFANWKPELLAGHAAEMVRLKVDVIVALNTTAAVAAQKATRTIPIVVPIVSDPVGSGLVASLARPGGNVTDCRSSSPTLPANEATHSGSDAHSLPALGLIGRDAFGKPRCRAGDGGQCFPPRIGAPDSGGPKLRGADTAFCRDDSGGGRVRSSSGAATASSSTGLGSQELAMKPV